MLRQIEIAARRNAFQLLRAEWKLEEKVHAGAGVMRQLLRLLPILFQRRARQADALVELDSFLNPILVPQLPAPIRLRFARMPRACRRRHRARNDFHRFVRLDEEFQLHLFELTRAEGEIARRHFVAERLAGLRDAERDFLAGRLQHVLELREDRLRRFRPEIGDAVITLHGTDVSLEHQVERAWFGELSTVFRIEPLRVLNLLCAFTQQFNILQAAQLIKLRRGFSRAFGWLARCEQHRECIVHLFA